MTSFNYCPGDSVLHNMDVRYKLGSLILLSFTSLKATPVSLSIVTILILICAVNLKLSIKVVFKDLSYVFIFLGFVFIARALSTDGKPLIAVSNIIITKQGIYYGLLVCWRILTVILMSFLFIATTKGNEIKAAVQWFLAPIPLIPEKRVAIMIALTLRFIPMILDQAKKTSEAQHARGIANRKNPIYRVVKFSIPMMRRSFETADKLAIAMEARVYSEERTEPEFCSTSKDIRLLCMVLCLSGFIFMI